MPKYVLLSLLFFLAVYLIRWWIDVMRKDQANYEEINRWLDEGRG